MKTKKRLLPALVLSAFTAFAAPDAQAQFSGVYVFGDSLSDAGYYRAFLLSLGLPAPVVAQLGRFTTNPGPVWAELVSQYYGFPAGPSNVSNGNIFAQGGARVAASSPSTPPGLAQRPVSTQIDEFLARSGGSADPNALYFVWAGGNDFLQGVSAFQAGQITQAQLQANVLGAATAEIAQVVRLRNAGARFIGVFALPNIGLAPASAAGGAASVAAATQLSAGYNTTLYTGLQSQGIRVIPIDVFALINEIAANPSRFGITNITGVACGPNPPLSTTSNSQFCLPPNLVAPDAATSFLFADPIHPTSATHRIIANFVEALIDGPFQYSYLAESALRTRAAHIRTLDDGIATARKGDPGLGVFAAFDRSTFDIDQGVGSAVGLDSNTRAVTLGVTARVGESVVLGAAYGQAKNNGTFGRSAGGFKARENIWSIFASARWGGFYGNAIASLADIDFNNVRRTFPIGVARRTADARPQGSNASAQIAAGYDLRIGRFTVGPTVMVTTQNVEVNQFDESGADSSNLRIYTQKRRSEVWSGGVRASATFGAWTPWLRITADKERRDDARVVSATPLTMAAVGTVYDIPAYQPDTTFASGAIGVNGAVTDRIGVSLAYFKVQGRSGIKEDGVSGVVSIKF